MAKYLSKNVVDESTENEANAHIAIELVANLLTGKAHVKEGGWHSVEGLATGKAQAIDPILWHEPDIEELVTLQDYPAGTKITDILFDSIGYRMVSMPTKPYPSGVVNPYYGGSFADIPQPSGQV